MEYMQNSHKSLHGYSSAAESIQNSHGDESSWQVSDDSVYDYSDAMEGVQNYHRDGSLWTVSVVFCHFYYGGSTESFQIASFSTYPTPDSSFSNYSTPDLSFSTCSTPDSRAGPNGKRVQFNEPPPAGGKIDISHQPASARTKEVSCFQGKQIKSRKIQPHFGQNTAFSAT